MFIQRSSLINTLLWIYLLVFLSARWGFVFIKFVGSDESHGHDLIGLFIFLNNCRVAVIVGGKLTLRKRGVVVLDARVVFPLHDLLEVLPVVLAEVQLFPVTLD